MKKSKVAAAKALIEAGADVNSLDAEGTPILHVAVSNGQLETVKLLLAHQVKLKAKDQYGLTALVYALKGQHSEMATLLKAAGGSY